MEDPLKDVLIKSSKLRRKKKQPAPKIFATLSVPYKEQYYPKLTDVFDKAVKEAFINKGDIFKLLVSPSGGGKTSSVYRQAEAFGYDVYRFDSSLSWNSEEIKDKMMNLASIKHNTPLVILLDDIDYNYLPVWLYPKKKITGYNKNGMPIIKRGYGNRQTFLQKAQKFCKKKNYTVIATCNESWKIDYEFKKFFEEVKTKGAYPSRLKKIAEELSMPLPDNFPRDLRQFHNYLQTGGVNKAYYRPDTPFAEIVTFLKKVPRGEIPKLRPPLETWIMINTLNSDSTGMVQRHNIKFYDIIATLCLADFYDCKDIIKALPKMGFLNQRQIRHPSKYYKQLKEQRGL